MDGASHQIGAGVGLQLRASTGERIVRAIRLGFPMSNNETEYEAILVGVDLAKSVSSERLIIRNDSQLVVGQVNREYETRYQCMVKYVSLVKQRLGSFVAWKLKHISRDSNERRTLWLTGPDPNTPPGFPGWSHLVEFHCTILRE